jgi:hypothetical protein
MNEKSREEINCRPKIELKGIIGDGEHEVFNKAPRKMGES